MSLKTTEDLHLEFHQTSLPAFLPFFLLICILLLIINCNPKYGAFLSSVSNFSELLNLMTVMGTPNFVASWSEVSMPPEILKLVAGICSEGSPWRTAPVNLSLTNSQQALREIRLPALPYFPGRDEMYFLKPWRIVRQSKHCLVLSGKCLAVVLCKKYLD